MKTRLRYCEEGEVHLDFHRSVNGTIAHLRKTYGLKFLAEVFRHTAQEVYASIWADLKRGDPAQLVAHWQHFMDREGGRYTIKKTKDEIRLRVTRCPAVAYLKQQKIPLDRAFCCQTKMLNQAWSEDTPFRIETKVLSPGRCLQTIKCRKTCRKGKA